MKTHIFAFFLWLFSFPARLIQFMRWIAVEIATERWYLWGFIPCSAGLWPLGLYCWNKEARKWYTLFALRILSYIGFIAGTILFIAGLWRFAGILILIRLLMGLDRWLDLGQPIQSESEIYTPPIFHHYLDRLVLFFIGAIFLAFAINKDRLIDFSDPSDHFYHMAVAQKILERGEIPLWDDWEFAPMGRPHLYPPLLHLLIAFFAGTPDRIVQGFSTIQMLLYPSVLFAYWLLFRTLLPPAHAFFSILFLSMQFVFSLGCLIGLPASVVNLFWPLILLSLLKRKPYPALLLLAAAFYTHTGMPWLISLSLLVFAIWKREYLLQTLAIVAGAWLLALPWMVRYFAFSDWMHAGGAQGYSLSSIIARLTWLQIIDPLFIGLAVWGWIRMKGSAVLKSQVIGFLPMLTQYGGRFFMHGTPFIAPFAAVHFQRFLPHYATRRRAVCFLLLTLVPFPCISFMGPNGESTVRPFFNITATHVGFFFMVNRQGKDQSDPMNLIETIKKTTSPTDIVYLPDENAAHFGDFITVTTGRRTDMGGWGEVSKPEMWETIVKNRENPNQGVFVSRHKEKIPNSRRIELCGSFYIGYPIDR